MPKRVLVNITTTANTAAIRHDKRNGRDVIVVPSATLPDDIVMNDIMYPADEIKNSFMTLNRSPAPAGHPLINNQFVSARDPEGINIGWIGAWNENVRRKNGRVFLDKVIDVERAGQTDKGKEVLNAIEQGDPIHTSTGLYCNLEKVEDKKHKFVARNIEFDHDAILVNEEGAATPDDGVGMMVNASGETEELEVINSALDRADEELDWAGLHLLRALESREKASVWERIKSAIMEAVQVSDSGERDTSANKGDADMADEKQLDELSAKVNAIEESLSGIGETITNAVTEAVKPLRDHVDEIKANQDAKDKAELDGLVDKIVKANILDETTAKTINLDAARALAKKAEPGKAATLNGAPAGGAGEDEFKDYDLNSGLKEAS